MSENDFSGYFDYGTKSPAAKPVFQSDPPGSKRKMIYLAVIFICSAGLVLLLFKSGILENQQPVAQTLPPGVPLEAPPLDQLPGGK